jgi:hypothetical protein
MSSSRSGQITAFAAIGAAFLALTPVVATAAAPPPTIAYCNPPGKGKFITYVASEATTSPTFVNIPKTHLIFNQGTIAGCVIVRFTASMQAAATGDMVVRALLDNATTAYPSSFSFGSADVTGATIEFIFLNVAPGIHHINMQFLSFGGGQASVSKPTTHVQFGQ